MSDAKKAKKPDLSKYIDDNIKNFDLLANRKRSSLEHKDNTGSTSTGTSSTKSSKFSIDAVESPTKPSKVDKANKENVVSSHSSSRSSKSREANPLETLKIPLSATASSAAGKVDDAVPGIHSRPKRVSFIASDPVVEEAPALSLASQAQSNTGTASVTRDVRSESRSSASPGSSATASTSAPTLAPPQPQPVQPHQALDVAQPAWGILGDPNRYVEMNGRHYIRLNVLGKGGSSCVYRIISADDGQIYAYKRVEVKDSEDVDAVFDSYANEIALLRKLSSAHGASSSQAHQHQHHSAANSPTIELIDCEVRRDRNYIAMVLEAGDIDLAKVLTQKNTAKTVINPPGGVAAAPAGVTASGSPGQSLLDPFFARMVWREMLQAVDHIHSHRIVHGDLKPANFVFVKGHLKLIDFGIAKSFSSDTTNIYRESQIGTINYMAPEAITPAEDSDCQQHKMRLGRASDIWSLGCILYQMVYGRPPFAALNTIQKLSTIPNPKHVIKYPEWGEPDAISSMRCCLIHDPRQRSKIQGPNGLLEQPYLKVPVITEQQGACRSAVASTVVGKDQVQNIVGAVLDVLSDAAQESLAKAQAAKPVALGVSTRTSRSSSRVTVEALEAQKVAQGVVAWIDTVDQTMVEREVMQVVEQEGWQVVPTTSVPAPAAVPTVLSSATSASAALPQPAVVTQPSTMQRAPSPVVPAAVLAPSPAHVPSAVPTSAVRTATRVPSQPVDSPALPPARGVVPPSPAPVKRKIADTPGSVTRSAAKRQALRAEPSSCFSIYSDPTPMEPVSSASAAAATPELPRAPSPVVPVIPAELSLISAPAPAAASATISSGGMARASTWAPVSISRPPPANLAGAASAASAQSGTVKPFNPKPAFLSNILSSSSRLTSFIGASTASDSAAVASTTETAPRAVAPVPAARSAAVPRRSPLKAMPLTLQQQIQLKAEQRLNSLNSSNSSAGDGVGGNKGAAVDRAAKWVKPPPVEEPSNLHSSLERQLGALRKLMNWDEEQAEVTETVDGSTFGFF